MSKFYCASGNHEWQRGDGANIINHNEADVAIRDCELHVASPVVPTHTQEVVNAQEETESAPAIEAATPAPAEPIEVPNATDKPQPKRRR